MAKNKINLALIVVMVIIVIFTILFAVFYISCQNSLTSYGNTISTISGQLSKCESDKNICTASYENCQSELQKERNKTCQQCQNCTVSNETGKISGPIVMSQPYVNFITFLLMLNVSLFGVIFKSFVFTLVIPLTIGITLFKFAVNIEVPKWFWIGLLIIFCALIILGVVLPYFL